ncbi:L,D-transpeptidase family protein [Salinimonas sp. HHU 13199]|uniref:L,D-transpeptidase family protein n=1 Tax=Salinimonas profundi TaxID=2729140 RepID=A0ABR8LLX8_9ALTE|nr:L,D-transpeptidase family protein [Salinimonas profundi]MBD3586568.1 L,D-transpeptidase family protein [Salinimonas profundi]
MRRGVSALLIGVLLIIPFQAASDENSDKTHQDLWFDAHHKLNLSGVELVSLLADLGMRDSAVLLPIEQTNPTATSQQLTRQLMAISQIKIGHQITTASLSAGQIMQAHASNSLAALIDSQLPQFTEVVQLRRAIVTMRQRALLPWPHIDEHFSPRLGQRHPQVTALITMLTRLGDYSDTHAKSMGFTPAVKRALQRFQARHGLAQSGRLDKPTREKLRFSPSQRLAVLQENLRRWLSLPAKVPAQYILVNIPAYTLYYRDKGKTVFSMPVVVGHPDTPTPIMLTEIDRVTLNPQWVPPASIVRNELLPRLNRAPRLMQAENFYWVDRNDRRVVKDIINTHQSGETLYQRNLLVQGPGPSNALGKWRFNIKNNDAIYLHDTPAKAFFSESQRALSHGCVRIADPEKLAQVLLNQHLDLTVSADQSPTTRHVRLSQPVATYLSYQTVQIRDGIIEWLPDIYQKDVAQLHTIIAQRGDTFRN